MAKYHRKQKFHFNFVFVVRMIIFSLIIFFSINYLSNSQSHLNVPLPDVLGQTVRYLPPQSQNTLQHLDSSPVVKFVQDKLKTLQQMSGDFPQKQITEIKKALSLGDNASVETSFKKLTSALKNNEFLRNRCKSINLGRN